MSSINRDEKRQRQRETDTDTEEEKDTLRERNSIQHSKADQAEN